MITVFDVAAEFTDRAGGEIEPVKLQKLCFYAFGCFAHLTGEALIGERFYAMRYGPVVGELLSAHAKADENGWDVVVAKKNVADIAGMPRPKAVGDPRGFLQVVVDRNSGLILGATLLAIESQEVINLVALAMNHEIPYTELRDAIYTHPAATEGLNWLLREI